jgi:hypothetical protein
MATNLAELNLKLEYVVEYSNTLIILTDFQFVPYLLCASLQNNF